MSAAKNKKPDDQDSSAQSVFVNKIRPYPFTVEVLQAEGVPPILGSAQKITDIGMLISLPANHYFKVNNNLVVRFELPGLKVIIQEAVKVVKTYQGVDQYINGEPTKTYVAEVHFRELNLKHKDKIIEFIHKIGQKG